MRWRFSQYGLRNSLGRGGTPEEAADAVYLFCSPESNYISGKASSAVAASSSKGGKPMQYRSSWMTEELDVFRDQFRKFLAKDLAPHAEKWRDQKLVDRSAWRALGEMGALLPSIPESYGGLGASFAYEAAVIEDHRNRAAGNDDRILGAQPHRGALHFELRVRGTETALAAEIGKRRDSSPPSP